MVIDGGPPAPRIAASGEQDTTTQGSRKSSSATTLAMRAKFDMDSMALPPSG